MSGTGHEGPSVIEQLAAYATGESFDTLPAATVVRRAGHPRHARRHPGGRRRGHGRARPRADRAPAVGGRGDDRRDVAARVRRGRRARQRRRRRTRSTTTTCRPRSPGTRRRRSCAAALALAERARRVGADLRDRVRGRRGDRGQARARGESRALRGRLARDRDARRLRRRRRRGEAVRALDRAHRARARHRGVDGERDQGELRHRRQAAARRPRRALRLEAALLAQAGFTGNPARSSTSMASAPRTAAAPSRVGPETVLDLGTPHEVVGPGHRREALPGVREHAPVARRDPRLDAGARDRPRCRARRSSARVYYLAPHQLIYERAQTGLQGKFSMPYCVSVALLEGSVGWPTSPTSAPVARTCRRSCPGCACSCTRSRPRASACPRASARSRSRSKDGRDAPAARVPGEGPAEEPADRRPARRQVPRLRRPRAAGSADRSACDDAQGAGHGAGCQRACPRARHDLTRRGASWSSRSQLIPYRLRVGFADLLFKRGPKEQSEETHHELESREPE